MDKDCFISIPMLRAPPREKVPEWCCWYRVGLAAKLQHAPQLHPATGGGGGPGMPPSIKKEDSK